MISKSTATEKVVLAPEGTAAGNGQRKGGTAA